MQKYYSSVETRVLHFATMPGEHHMDASRKPVMHANSCVRVRLNGRNDQL
jgi:hypothetical protein